MAMRLLANRHKMHGWLLTLLVVLCVAMMGQILLLEMHHHAVGDTSGTHCWVCASGPALALITAAVLVLPTEPAALLLELREEADSAHRVLLERRRGPPAHS